MDGVTRRKYHYRGQIEVGSATAGYRWVRGYSRNGRNGEVQYPWMSREQCRAEAKRDGATPVFVEEGL